MIQLLNCSFRWFLWQIRITWLINKNHPEGEKVTLIQKELRFFYLVYPISVVFFFFSTMAHIICDMKVYKSCQSIYYKDKGWLSLHKGIWPWLFTPNTITFIKHNSPTQFCPAAFSFFPIIVFILGYQ